MTTSSNQDALNDASTEATIGDHIVMSNATNENLKEALAEAKKKRKINGGRKKRFSAGLFAVALVLLIVLLA